MDGLGPGIEAAVGELLAEGHDLLLVEIGDRGWARNAVASSGARARLRRPGGSGPGAGRASCGRLHRLAASSPDGLPVRRWVSITNRPLSISDLPHRCRLCLDTSGPAGVAYVMNSGTAVGTRLPWAGREGERHAADDKAARRDSAEARRRRNNGDRPPEEEGQGGERDIPAPQRHEWGTLPSSLQPGLQESEHRSRASRGENIAVSASHAASLTTVYIFRRNAAIGQ